ncbi:hypothetical protein CIB48_g9066 [Xylaria polymorpha]|nr:hypothetical protein CIB48_g9066 [Xylaria polymorpha]
MAVQHEYLHNAESVPTTTASKKTVTVSTQGVATPETFRDEAQDLLVISPYTEREHLLNLKNLDIENAILAQALVHLKCLRSDYATAPYIDTFNWREVVEQVKRLAQQNEHRWKGSSFFVVAFRSQIPPTTVYEDLGTLDKAAHAEATASDTGLEALIRMAKIWQRACGDRKRTQGKEVSDPRIDGQPRQPGTSIPIGRLTGTGLSFVTKWKAGRLPTGRDELVTVDQGLHTTDASRHTVAWILLVTICAVLKESQEGDAGVPGYGWRGLGLRSTWQAIWDEEQGQPGVAESLAERANQGPVLVLVAVLIA